MRKSGAERARTANPRVANIISRLTTSRSLISTSDRSLPKQPAPSIFRSESVTSWIASSPGLHAYHSSEGQSRLTLPRLRVRPARQPRPLPRVRRCDYPSPRRARADFQNNGRDDGYAKYQQIVIATTPHRPIATSSAGFAERH